MLKTLVSTSQDNLLTMGGSLKYLQDCILVGQDVPRLKFAEPPFICVEIERWLFHPQEQFLLFFSV
jgi:hypothetical protein